MPQTFLNRIEQKIGSVDIGREKREIVGNKNKTDWEESLGDTFSAWYSRLCFTGESYSAEIGHYTNTKEYSWFVEDDDDGRIIDECKAKSIEEAKQEIDAVFSKIQKKQK